MRVLVAAAIGATIVAAADLATAEANPAWAGLSLWRFDGEAFPGYPLPAGAEPVARPGAAPSVEALRAYAREASYVREVSGVTVGGLAVSTSRDSQGLIDRAIALFAADPSLASVEFDAGDAAPVTLTAAQVRAVGVAVGRHVQAAFAARAAALRGIADGTVTTLPQVDAALAGDAA